MKKNNHTIIIHDHGSYQFQQNEIQEYYQYYETCGSTYYYIYR